MAKTGEKYGAARRVLIEQSVSRDPRDWVSEPQQSDPVIRVKLTAPQHVPLWKAYWSDWLAALDEG
jgi:hypothetical protein